MITGLLPLSPLPPWVAEAGPCFKKRVGTDDTLNNRKQRVVVFGRVADDRPDLRHVEVL